MQSYLTLPLYEGNIEGAIPEIYVYLPQQRTDTLSKAVIISGGGGFNHVNLEHEGHQFAQWLSSIGIAGIVLNYRLPNGQKDMTEVDCRQAVRLVRKYADEWNIDKSNIGAAGFSIGGHAVAMLSVCPEEDSMLNFTILFYSVVSMKDELTHLPSRDKLLGEEPREEDIMFYSPLGFVSDKSAKCLILASDDDKVVSPLNSVKFYKALKKNNVRAGLCIYPSGGHGWGMKEDFLYHDEMLSIVKKWISSF